MTDDPEARAAALADGHEALDFTPASLGALDGLAAEAPVDGLAAYFGEVVRRARDGEWVSRDGRPGVDVGSGAVDVERTARAVRDGETTFRASARALGVDDGTPLAEYAVEAAERVAAAWPERDLDFTPASLARLDNLAAAEFDEYEGADEVSRELLAAATPLALYLGETLRRSFDEATWVDAGGPRVVVRAGDSDDGVGVDVLEAAAGALVAGGGFDRTHERLAAAARE